MKTTHTFPIFLAIAVCSLAQTQPNSTPTPLEALILKQPASAIHKQLVGRLVDGSNTVTVSTVTLLPSEGKEMQGLEFVIATASKRDTVYLERDRLKELLKVANRDMERERIYLVNKCRERGATGCWDGFPSSIVGDPVDLHMLTPGWLVAGSDNLGTAIDIPGFHFELQNTPFPKFLELVSQGFARLTDNP